VAGFVERNGDERTIHVEHTSPPLQIAKGDIVLAVVENIMEMMASLRILRVIGSKRSISSETVATLHISKASPGYVANLREVACLRDIVRAEVIETEPSVQVNLNGKGLGVVKAYCTQCGCAMVKEDAKADYCRNAYCPRCDRVEKRLLVPDYGRMNLDAEFTPEQYPPVPVDIRRTEERRDGWGRRVRGDGREDRWGEGRRSGRPDGREQGHEHGRRHGMPPRAHHYRGDRSGKRD